MDVIKPEPEATESVYEQQPNELHIAVIQGRHLARSHLSMDEPQVRLLMNGFNEQMTPTSHSSSPIWKSRLVFSGVTDDTLSLVAVVEDHDDLQSAAFVGKICIPLNQFIDQRPSKRWYVLRNSNLEVDGVNRGEIELLIHWKYSAQVRKCVYSIIVTRLCAYRCSPVRTLRVVAGVCSAHNTGVYLGRLTRLAVFAAGIFYFC
jgi:hypothetical protein